LAGPVAEISRPAQIGVYTLSDKGWNPAFSMKLPYFAFIMLTIGLAFAAAWRAKLPII
jgi:hypothetical protein